MTFWEWKNEVSQVKSKLDIRKERVEEFFKNEEWKNHQKLSEWAIKNDIKYLRKYDAFEYEYEYKYIMYYEYQVRTALPPIEPKENHFWCRYCRDEKPQSEARGTSICTPCAKQYRRDNYAEKERNAMREKYHSDKVHRMGCVIKAHINHILNGRFNKMRDRKWEETVGLSKKEFLEYILSMCQPDWNMDNYGTEWVIQHIIPRDWAEVEEDAYLLNYYKNLMPWGFSDNAALSNGVEPTQFNEWHHTNERIQQLIQNHLGVGQDR